MKCSYHPTCPGCPLLSHPYPEQLRQKQERLQRAFDLFPHLRLKAPPVLPALHTGAYRHRMKLHVHIRDRDARVGLADPRTGHVLDTPDCPVLSEKLRAGLGTIREWMAGKHGIHSLDLRQSAATGELQAVFACSQGRLPGGEKALGKLLAKLPALASVAVSVADPERRRVKGDAPRVMAGREWIGEGIGAARYRIHPGAFFQVDPRNAAQIHALLRELAGTGAGTDAGTKAGQPGGFTGSVLDLYGGVGAYSVMFAQAGASVVMVEEDAAACRGARAVAPAGMRVIEGRAEDITPAAAPARAGASSASGFDLALLNPARRGSDPRLLRRLPELAATAIYVSCSPESLARDLDTLAAAGMQADAIRAIDLFPQTPEVETVVRLRRAPPLQRWPVPGGEATGPDAAGTSGAVGTPAEVLALLIGDTGSSGQTNGASWERVSRPAGHSLLKISLSPPATLPPLLRSLRDRGHPLAGEDARTRAFFEDKALLQRPFLHVSRAGSARAPLHGDLQIALDRLNHR